MNTVNVHLIFSVNWCTEHRKGVTAIVCLKNMTEITGTLINLD